MEINHLARNLLGKIRRGFSGRFKSRKWIAVIINPAAGQSVPDLKKMNRLIHQAGMEWELQITNTFGDGARLAAKAVSEGASMVVACGGDGTVMDVAAGLLGSQVPLALLPVGTGNVMSKELGIPQDLDGAINVILDPSSVRKPIDLGMSNAQLFLMRLGVGMEAEVVRKSDRETKDKFGMLAYGAAILQSVGQPPMANYRLTLDGETIETEALAVMVANAAALGVTGLALPSNVRPDDGLLDVYVIRRSDLRTISAVVQAITTVIQTTEIPHWQVKQVRIEADPPQGVQADGEDLGSTPIEVTVLPSALRVVVPQVPTVW